MSALCEACEKLNYKLPTPIQQAAIPPALQGILPSSRAGQPKDGVNREGCHWLGSNGLRKDCGLCHSSVTSLVEQSYQLLLRGFSSYQVNLFFFEGRCTKSESRELAIQIAASFEALGSAIGVRCAVLVGGMDIMSQAIALSKKPHIIIATPGRLQYHLENTKGFSLKTLKYLVFSFFGGRPRIG